MLRKNLLYFLVALLALTSCENNKPKADFSFEVSRKKVFFKNLSENYYRCEWIFGDGTNVFLRAGDGDPIHEYLYNGTYLVTLAVWNEDEEMAEVSYTVTISDTGSSSGGGTGGTGGGTGGSGGGTGGSGTGGSDSKPTSVYVKSYTVNSISFVDSEGDYWDDSKSDGPDIYMRIYDGSTEIYNFDDDVYYDVTSYDLPFTKSLGVKFTNLTKTYTFKLCDYDTWFVDYMYSFTFRPSDFTSDRPATLYAESKGFSISISLEWR